MEEEVKIKVKDFLGRFFKNEGDDDDIFALGLVNSLFAMQLILFLESQFLIKVENTDIDINNYRTVNSITNFVITKLKNY